MGEKRTGAELVTAIRAHTTSGLGVAGTKGVPYLPVAWFELIEEMERIRAVGMGAALVEAWDCVADGDYIGARDRVDVVLKRIEKA